jgi:hypothetical protein
MIYIHQHHSVGEKIVIDLRQDRTDSRVHTFKIRFFWTTAIFVVRVCTASQIGGSDYDFSVRKLERPK